MIHGVGVRNSYSGHMSILKTLHRLAR